MKGRDVRKSFFFKMVDSLHNLIASQGDAIIPNLRYAELAAPTASYVFDKRSTRVPFLAPTYSSDNVSVHGKVCIG